MEEKKRIIIIGGGAAGYFAAISAAIHHPNASVTILEKSQQVLGKVKVSGGGRCNVTNGAKTIKDLCLGYPRGEKLLKNLFKEFNNQHTIQWFESKGVPLKTEPDGRVFPKSDSSQSIIDCLQKEHKTLGINLLKSNGVSSLEKLSDGGWKIITLQNEQYFANFIIIATGGHPNLNGYDWLKILDIPIELPVPSLFTFNCPTSYLKPLMGVSVADAKVKIVGQKYNFQGPILITHWGFSGPAILKLSSFAAIDLAKLNYSFKISINWIPNFNEEKLRLFFETIKKNNPKKSVQNTPIEGISTRLWIAFCEFASIATQQIWADLTKQKLNILIEQLTNSVFEVSGKTTFKEEFVTSGGVSLEAINHETLESKHHKGLYFAGEVLNIDGITGGYNFQAAWTTAWKSGQLLD